jgi:hypothetical protein
MNQTKYLYLVPYAGLCNRMNAISSAIMYSKEKKVNCKIYWRNDSDLSADFNELFEDFSINNIELIKMRWYHFYFFRPRRFNQLLLIFIRSFFFSKQLNDWNRKSGDIKNLEFRKIYLSTCHAIGPLYNLKELFKPLPHIQSIINEYLKKFNEFTVGVHIRRTDHKQCINDASLQDFANKIKVQISKSHKANFFIATDSSEVKNYMSEKFGDKIITFENTLNRTSLDGMIDAVVDLWLLSSTRFIIGSRYSTYSLLASKLGKIELVF